VGRHAIAAFLAVASVALGAGVAGCGSAAPSIGPVVRAADATAQVPGYRIAASMQVTTPVVGSLQMTMNGVYDRPTRSGFMTAAETVGGRQLQFSEVFSGLTFYLRTAHLPSLARLTHGRPWLKFDMSRMLGAMGVGALPTGTDPSQFVDYLRAVSSATTRQGSATIRGFATAHYHAVIDLDHYSKLVPRKEQATAQRGIRTLEAALGSHSMPLDVWIDHRNLVRRIRLAFSECISGQRIRFGMTMDLYSYGPQPQPSLPSSNRAYDVTPMMAATLSKIRFGCAAA
jgi:hypothetical protein